MVFLDNMGRRGLELIRQETVLLVVRLADDTILVIDKKYGRVMLCYLIRRHISIGHDDDLVAYTHTLGCSAVEADDSRTAFSRNGVSLKAIAIVNIDDLDFLVFEDAGLVQQIDIDRDTTYIIKVCLCDCGTMDLGLEESDVHLFADDNVIDESGLADEDSDGDERLTADGLYALDVLKVNDFDIIYACQRFGVEVLLDDVDDLRRR